MKVIENSMGSLTVSRLPGNSFLSDVHVVETLGSEKGRGKLTTSTGDGRLDSAIAKVAETGHPQLIVDALLLPADCAASVMFPIHHDGEVVSVVVLNARSYAVDRTDGTRAADPIGVFEIWKPVGPYDEVALADGFFGPMERFHNVSRFVRFEFGTGLPGLVWQQRTAVIHDDLGNHPGFLRAAGASADLLHTGLGLPVGADEFSASVVLLSSRRTPIARGFEVWQADKRGFELVGGSYHGLGDSFALLPGTRWRHDAGVLGLVVSQNNAVLSDDVDRLMHGREGEGSTPGPTAALAVPQFERSDLKSVAMLMF